jgi:hypothetical protein
MYRPYIIVVVWPGEAILIIPPQLHINFEELLIPGIPPMRVTGFPGVHGATVIGMHGAGVGTPKAAAVMAMTIGFAGD